MPCVFKHVAVMPDCHYGKGATVGTVLATEHALIPAAVGVRHRLTSRPVLVRMLSTVPGRHPGVNIL